MRNTTLLTVTFITALILLASCSNEKDEIAESEIIVRAAAEEFSSLKVASLESKLQNFEFDASQTGFLTTDKGVQLVINGSCLKKDGNSVTGMITLEVVELFERGSMLTTNKPTMGMLPNGDKALLISGGELFIKATHDGDELELDCSIQAVIPASLTAGGDTEMTLWYGNGRDNDCDGIDDDCDGIVWEEVTNGGQDEQVEVLDGDEGPNFFVYFSNLGWTNVDKFYTDSRPKTSLLVDVPAGFDNTNSAVYLSFDSEPNALANLDRYIAATELFSEHYGQIPIGLECHVIFVSEQDGEWLYAIKPTTVADGETITILDADLISTTENLLETLVNNLP